MSTSTADAATSDTGNATPVSDKDYADSRLPLPSDLADRGRCPFEPPPRLVELSTQAPVQRITLRDGREGWLITGHAEGRAFLADPRASAERLTEQAIERLPEKLRERAADKEARAGTFIFMDPPDHTRYRKLLTGQFTVRRMRQLEPRIAQIVADHIDAMVAAGDTADLVPAFALPVPSLVICELLGVHYEDREEFQSRTALLLSRDADVDDVIEVGEGLNRFMLDLVREKRENPGDDLLSGLVHAATEPALTDTELANIANLLLIAGHETTANMLSLGTFALLEHPDQLARLRDDPSLIDGAVEELLRFLSIIHFGINRTTTEEVELAGEVIPADATVIVSVVAANRDPDTYPSPDELDVTRQRVSHLAFGHGIHQCLGQQLARVEMTVGFTELLRRLPGLRLAVPASQVRLRDDMLIYGAHSLPVTWDA
ncbi:cytochrome P450 [Actinosynnema sp. NPDC020468]|uniref:cytochrome P450 n=1 Tax=Actinosynnema sp. NPDC020468 TaxID=3154488 RepID=UPI0033EA48D0